MNIAEGAGRDSDRDFRRFIAISKGSTNETEYGLVLAQDLGYAEAAEVEAITDSLRRIRSMLTRLRQALAEDRG